MAFNPAAQPRLLSSLLFVTLLHALVWLRKRPFPLSLVIRELIIDFLYLIREKSSQWPRFGTR